jgi:hypothetical protein
MMIADVTSQEVGMIVMGRPPPFPECVGDLSGDSAANSKSDRSGYAPSQQNLALHECDRQKLESSQTINQRSDLILIQIVVS